jgi:hypothetical protein
MLVFSQRRKSSCLAQLHGTSHAALFHVGGSRKQQLGESIASHVVACFMTNLLVGMPLIFWPRRRLLALVRGSCQTPADYIGVSNFPQVFVMPYVRTVSLLGNYNRSKHAAKNRSLANQLHACHMCVCVCGRACACEVLRRPHAMKTNAFLFQLQVHRQLQVNRVHYLPQLRVKCCETIS